MTREDGHSGETEKKRWGGIEFFLKCHIFNVVLSYFISDSTGDAELKALFFCLPLGAFNEQLLLPYLESMLYVIDWYKKKKKTIVAISHLGYSLLRYRPGNYSAQVQLWFQRELGHWLKWWWKQNIIICKSCKPIFRCIKKDINNISKVEAEKKGSFCEKYPHLNLIPAACLLKVGKGSREAGQSYVIPKEAQRETFHN